MNSNNPQNSAKRKQGLRLVAVTALVAALALSAFAGAGAVAAQSAEENATSPDFEVTISNTNSPVDDGEPITVTATVTNTGNESGTQAVSAEAPGVGDSGVFVSLTEGQSTTETFSIQTNPRDIGDHTVIVESEDDNATTVVTVDRD
jgi:uncharacterized protein (DUF58 family)